MYKIIFALVFAFFLGSIPFGFILTYLFSKEDIRKIGSGNIGATNVSRRLGLLGGILTFLLDFLKGFFAVFIIQNLTPIPYFIGFGSVLAVLGHCYTPFLRFKGGKGVATSFGVFLKISPIPALISLFIFLLVLFIFRYVSFSSLISASLFPPILYFFKVNEGIILSATFISLIIIIRHKENIKRLIKKEEPKVGKKL